MTTPEKPGQRISRPGVLKHSVFGSLALAVAALDFSIGGTALSVAGIAALAISAYSFAKAAHLRKAAHDEENRP